MDGRSPGTVAGPRRPPEGPAPGRRASAWSWGLLVAVLLAAAVGVAWAMLAGTGGEERPGALVAVGVAVLVVLAALIIRGGPVLAAAWFRRKDRRHGP